MAKEEELLQSHAHSMISPHPPCHDTSIYGQRGRSFTTPPLSTIDIPPYMGKGAGLDCPRPQCTQAHSPPLSPYMGKEEELLHSHAHIMIRPHPPYHHISIYGQRGRSFTTPPLSTIDSPHIWAKGRG